jgi:phage terminase large subunit GpA-like protein
MIGASQVMGKTEVINNIIGFHMDYRPTSTVVMYPTIETAEKFSKKKLTPAINATPCLSEILASGRSRDSGNTILVKDFRGGSIFIVGSNSTSSLRGASGPVLIGDEIDDYESDIGGQGDPIDLLWKRGESYPNVVKVLSSTPTVQGHSRIWDAWETSDQQHWFMPCVHCGVRLIFKWSVKSKLNPDLPFASIEWTKGNAKTAHLVCAQCSREINDTQRRDMYFAGDWDPTAKFHGIRGFHLNWLYCPWPAHKGFDNRLHEMAEEWERATKKGTNSLKVLINTGLCECFEAEYEKPPDWEGLSRRLEPEPQQGEVPEMVVYLTAFVDVQGDRLELHWKGWGVGEESWGLLTRKLFGSPHSEQVWQELDAELSRKWQHPSGAVLKLGCALIDSGGVSDAKAFSRPVYRFVRPRQGRYIFAAKGSSEVAAPLFLPKLQKNGVLLHMIGSDICKSEVYTRLTLDVPGPLYCHWLAGRGYDEEWFKQLTAERVSIVGKRRQWVKVRARNEALDMEAGNIAAFEIRNPNLEAIAENMRRTVAVMTAPKVEPVQEPIEIKRIDEPPAPVLRRRRRIGFVKW